MIVPSIVTSVLSVVVLNPAPTGFDAAFSNRIIGTSAQLPQCLSRFLDYPPGAGKLGFPRCLFETPFPTNPVFWLKDADFSCASPWNDSFGRFRAGTAISKRHVIFARHFQLDVGTRVAFVGQSGDVSHYSIKAKKSIEDSDIAIGLLDYELTPDVHPAKVLPVDYNKWLTDRSKWPVVTFNQNKQLLLSELTCEWNQKVKEMFLINRWTRNEQFGKLGGKIVVGDSGNPAFMIYKGHPILLYCLFLGCAGSGPQIHQFRRQIQETMDDLCPGYKLDTFDFESAQR